MADSAMATRTETLQGKLALDTSAWSRGLAQASTMFKGFSGGISRGLSQAFQNSLGAIKGTLGKIGGMIRSTLGSVMNMAGIGGVLSGGGILAGLNNAGELAGQINDLSVRTGIAASTLMVMREQFRQGGLEIESVTQYIRKMFDALDDPKKANVFAQLGLDPSSLARMNPDMAFNKILDGVRKLSSRVKQTNILGEIFGGRGGINLMTLVADPTSFASAKEMVGSVAADMDKVAPELDKIQDILGPGGIGVKMQQIFLGILMNFKTDLLDLANKFSKLDFKAVGDNIAEWLRWGWKTFQNLVSNPSGVWAAMASGFKGVAFLTASYLLGAIQSAVVGGVGFATKVLPSLLKALWFGMKAVGGAIAIGIMEGLQVIKEMLPQSVRDGMDRTMRFFTEFQDRTPFGMMMNKITGTTASENYDLIAKDPQIVQQAFEQGMIKDLLAASNSMGETFSNGSEVFDKAIEKFAPNAALLAESQQHLSDALQIFRTVPMPTQNPLQALTTSPAAQPQIPSLFRNTGERGGLKVSLDGNKIDVSGMPSVSEDVRAMRYTLEEALAFE